MLGDLLVMVLLWTGLLVGVHDAESTPGPLSVGALITVDIMELMEDSSTPYVSSKGPSSVPSAPFSDLFSGSVLSRTSDVD